MKAIKQIMILAALCLSTVINAQEHADVRVDIGKATGTMKPIWAWFGYDEPNYTYMKDGRRLLTDIAESSPVPVNVRIHNLLTTGDGTPALKWGSTNAYTEDKKGRPVYDWTIIDRIFDTLVERGMRPLVEIGFMPEALSTNPRPYRHNWKPGDDYDKIYTGWSYPPKDYNKWRELVYQWAMHCKERYGAEEVAKWYWEVWNEPVAYLHGTFEDYCRMYDYAADGLLKALPGAVIGGPHTYSPSGRKDYEYLKGFLEHCARGKNYATGKTGSPLGYIGFHAKGWPQFSGDKVSMHLGKQLRAVKKGFELIASVPEFRHLPVIIGEFDPEGCAACSSEYTPQFNYRNGTLYSSTVANSYARLYEIARRYDINLIGAVTWAFEFENQPWFAGFRDLATNGVAKPVLNVFRMFGLMGGNLVEASSTGMIPVDSIYQDGIKKNADIGVLASRRGKEATVMLWNYHDLNMTDVPPASISLTVDGCDKAGRVLISHYRVDETHSNSYAEWLKMGSPKSPDLKQMASLERCSRLQLYEAPKWIRVKDGKIALSFKLPRQGVSLLKMEW